MASLAELLAFYPADNEPSNKMREVITSLWRSGPRIRNNYIALLGDSRLAEGTGSVATEQSKLSRGIITWLQFLSRARFNFRYRDNFGVSGENTRQIYNRTASALRISDAGTFLVLCGTNDRTSTFTALGARSGQPPGGTDTLVNIRAIVDMLRAAGRNVIIIAELPRGNSSATGTRLDTPELLKHLTVRQFILSLRGEEGVYVVDAWERVGDFTSTTGDNLATYFRDGLHENELGGLAIAQACLPVVEHLFPETNILPASAADAWSLDQNPYGIISLNPMFTGSGGTLTTGGSGTLGDSWQELGTPGFTRTYSKVADPDGFGSDWQQVVFGGTATGTSMTLRQFVSSQSGLAWRAGDVVQAVAEVAWDDDIENVVAFAFGTLAGGTNNWAADFRPANTNSRVPNGPLAGVMTSPPYTIGPSDTNLQLLFNYQVVSGADPVGTFRFRRAALRRLNPERAA